MRLSITNLEKVYETNNTRWNIAIYKNPHRLLSSGGVYMGVCRVLNREFLVGLVAGVAPFDDVGFEFVLAVHPKALLQESFLESVHLLDDAERRALARGIICAA